MCVLGRRSLLTATRRARPFTVHPCHYSRLFVYLRPQGGQFSSRVADIKENIPVVASTAASLTGQPTGAPTLRPTDRPTQHPTTLLPTSEPTTSAPTSQPTTEPTRHPTLSPSDSPSGVPTSRPTSEPTYSAPSRHPTTAPTAIPTKSPTFSPTTSNPTLHPTTEPTLNPTVQPTTFMQSCAARGCGVGVFTAGAECQCEDSCIGYEDCCTDYIAVCLAPTNSPVYSTAAPTTSEPTTSVPTVMPTTAPTESPTASPTTSGPSQHPATSEPTASTPTLAPTDHPTFSPTVTYDPCHAGPCLNGATCINMLVLRGDEEGRVERQIWFGSDGDASGDGVEFECVCLEGYVGDTCGKTAAPTTSPSTHPTAEPTDRLTGFPTTSEPTASLPTPPPTPHPTTRPTTSTPTTSEPSQHPATLEPTTSMPTPLSPAGCIQPVDLRPECPAWQAIGFCITSDTQLAVYMMEQCRLSCGVNDCPDASISGASGAATSVTPAQIASQTSTRLTTTLTPTPATRGTRHRCPGPAIMSFATPRAATRLISSLSHSISGSRAGISVEDCAMFCIVDAECASFEFKAGATTTNCNLKRVDVAGAGGTIGNRATFALYERLLICPSTSPTSSEPSIAPTTSEPTTSVPTMTPTMTPTPAPTDAPTARPTACLDTFEVAHCEHWDTMGHCNPTSDFYNFMAVNCRGTCLLCQQSTTATTIPPTSEQTTLADGTACQDSPVNWVDRFGSNCKAYRRQELCTHEGGFGMDWNTWRMNMTFTESASVYGVSGPDACCACGGGNRTLVSTDEGKQGLDAASGRDDDDDATVEMLSYTVFIIAITISLCALMLLLVRCDRVIQRRRAAVISQERNKQSQIDQLQHPIIMEQSMPVNQEADKLTYDDTAVFLAPTNTETVPDNGANGVGVADASLGKRPALSAEVASTTPPVDAVPNSAPTRVGSNAADVAGLLAAGLVDGANEVGVADASVGKRPALSAENSSTTPPVDAVPNSALTRVGSNAVDVAGLLAGSNAVDVAGLLAAGLVDGIVGADVVLFEGEYVNGAGYTAGSRLGSPILFNEELQQHFDEDLQHIERNLSRLTSIATHSTASTVSEVDYNGPSFANFFDNREDTMALERRGAAGIVVTEADLTGTGDAPPVSMPWTPPIAAIRGVTGGNGVPHTLEHSTNNGGINTNFYDDQEAAMTGPAAPAAQDGHTAEPEPTMPAVPAEASAEPAGPAEVGEEVVPSRIRAVEAAVVEADLTAIEADLTRSAAPSRPELSAKPVRQKSWHPRAAGSGWDLVHAAQRVEEEKVTESRAAATASPTLDDYEGFTAPSTPVNGPGLWEGEKVTEGRAAAAASPALDDYEGSTAPSTPVNGLGLWARDISNSPALRAQAKNGLQSLEPH